MPLELKYRLEALLFTSPHPQTITTLAAGLGVMQNVVESSLKELAADYQDRGVRLIRKGDEVRLVTAPELGELIRQFHRRSERDSLTRAGLETLAIVIHREPVTRSEIEEIRGVNSERILRSLQIRGLIREAGVAESLGRPTLYATSIELLQHFGLERPEAAPPLPELEFPATEAPTLRGE